ncbi:MAG: hypothetical protein AAFY76_17615 [Cyanobacteria bacterium J06649_11]
MASLLSVLALTAKINQYCYSENKYLVAKHSFSIKLYDGQRIRVNKGQKVLLGSDSVSIGDFAFDPDESDGLGTALLKAFANVRVSEFESIDWDDIKSIS